MYMKLCGNNFNIFKYLTVNKSNISTPRRAKIFLSLAVGDSPQARSFYYMQKLPWLCGGGEKLSSNYHSSVLIAR